MHGRFYVHLVSLFCPQSGEQILTEEQVAGKLLTNESDHVQSEQQVEDMKNIRCLWLQNVAGYSIALPENCNCNQKKGIFTLPM